VIHAPVAIGAPEGELRVLLDGQVVYKTPLVAQNAIAEAGFFKRLWHGIYLFFRELFS
jgi:D-alanyl-D-alanine carboxypeptidase (penicillin-binding protein 5/6)